MASDRAGAQIDIRNVDKVFSGRDGDVVALRDIDLEIGKGEFVCLLGPSGCGKSTLLNAIAGFSLPTAGTLQVEGAQIMAPGPDRGMVFQEYALFPWMSVERNIAFGLEIKRAPRPVIDAKVNELLDVLGLREFRARYPKDLSGGMRQRVAIARALAIEPNLLLMDEPFASLDVGLRRRLQNLVVDEISGGDVAAVFVTHDVAEAVRLATRIVVLSPRPARIVADFPNEPVAAAPLIHEAAAAVLRRAPVAQALFADAYSGDKPLHVAPNLSRSIA